MYNLVRLFKGPKQDDIDESVFYDESIKNIKNGFACEFYYSLESSVYKMKIIKNKISFYQFNLSSNKFLFVKIIEDKECLKPFFYSMVINYSFYAFNSYQIGMWIKAFFHKNDGYQMPVVINPYRDKGDIDVNNETYLTRSRLLANVLSIEEYKNINVKSKIEKVELNRDGKKYDNYRYLKNGDSRFSSEFINNFRDTILKPLYEKMFSYSIKAKYFKMEYPVFDIKQEDDNRVFAEYYLINKLITISSRYDTFTKYDYRRKKEKDIVDNFQIEKLNIDEFIKDIYEDRSHITLKIRQTLNFIRENIFSDKNDNHTIIINLMDVVKKMNSLRNKDFFSELVDYLPPPIFFSEIYFEDKSTFTDMSSGEKQQISSINSVIYHLNNIDSVHKSSSVNADLIMYDTINLIFDEIELYFHPEFQKNYIFKLLKLIKDARFKNLNNINIVFLTHSPFILSDIPNQNIMYLNEGNLLKGKARPQKSFGANITDLLADGFFFGNGDKALIGDFAREKIKQVIKWLNNEESKILNKEEAKMIIEIIDEPLLKYKLLEMYFDIFPEQYDLEKEKEEVRKRAIELGIIKERND